MSWEMGVGHYLFWNALNRQEKGMPILGKGAKAFLLATMVLLVVLFILIEKDVQRSRREKEQLFLPDPGTMALPTTLPRVPSVYYKVEPGDTLPKIARKVYGESGLWKRIWKANWEILPSPRHLQVGMRLVIPLRDSSVPFEPAIQDQAER